MEIIINFIIIIFGAIITNFNDNLGTVFFVLGILSLFFSPILTFLFKLLAKEKKNIITQTDNDNKNWVFKRKDFAFNEKNSTILINNHQYNFGDILNFELLIDDNTISKTDTSSVLARTLLFGDIIGGTTAKKKNINYCTQLKIKITINNLSNPVEYINFMDGFSKIKKSSLMYKKISKNVDECLSILSIITNKNK